MRSWDGNRRRRNSSIWPQANSFTSFRCQSRNGEATADVMRILLVVAITAALVLSYGYYHAATHGWLHINLMDTSLKPYGENSRNAKIRLLDGNGHALADAASDNKFGVVRLVHPEAGDCSAEESSASSSSAVQEQWQKCSATLSTWLVELASRSRVCGI